MTQPASAEPLVPENRPMPTGTLARAASYARMSTQSQNFSIELQREKLNAYALEHGFQIVQAYADEGKSGLRMAGRRGLQALIADVQTSRAQYEYILVYDVSRWGRFQDVDESAYYEHICRSAGIKVIYCAEQFANDGSPLAAILKAIKRSMAAEFSRELSVKVFAAQSRFAALGYKQGGGAGYALRRLSVRVDGHIIEELEYGATKGAPTNRVTLVPGPAKEVAVLRQIYRWYVAKGMGDTQIARMLNARGIVAEHGRLWTAWLVKNLLVNEKYCGHNVFNRRSFKLKRESVLNPVDIWIRKDGAFPALISAALFAQAQAVRAARLERRNGEAMLAMVRSIYVAHGRVTAKLMIEHDRSSAPKLLAKMFGSITEAYVVAGIPSETKLRYGRSKNLMNTLRKQLLQQMEVAIPQAGGFVSGGPTWSTLEINNQISVRLAVARCRYEIRGLIRWRIAAERDKPTDFILVARLDHANAEVLDFFLIPSAALTRTYIVIRDESLDDMQLYRYPTLRSVFGLSENF